MADTSADNGGCDVVPAIAAQAASTASTPASIAASRVPNSAARGVVGVQMQGQVEALPQRGHQPPRGGRAKESRHVLDREHVRAGVDDPLGQRQVVVQRVQLLVRVEEVAGVAQRDLGDAPVGAPHRLDRRPNLLDVVERVEDPKHVDPGSAAPCTNAVVTSVGYGV